MPPGVTTVTSTVPVPAGLVAMICWPCRWRWSPRVVPKSTAVALVKFVPVIVTVVPPVEGPDVGLMLVTVGRHARR